MANFAFSLLDDNAQRMFFMMSNFYCYGLTRIGSQNSKIKRPFTFLQQQSIDDFHLKLLEGIA
ncbi:hypothetical protein JCM19233_3149 [Vibrio astriarenae]|nr:hypothetical protein JCM19233_3149 [Vibrio sp. C7]